jgi:non-heme chloroperoxidase
MRSRTAPALGASTLLSLAALAGCASDPDHASARSHAPLFYESSFSKQTTSLSTGITMKYVEAGDPNGEPVILLHGFTDTSRSFFPTIQALVDANTDLHVYALEARGHGGSSMPMPGACRAAPEQCFEMSEMAADVLAFMGKKNISSAHVVGHSMGSLVAQELALTAPHRVDSILLIGSTASGVGNPVIEYFLFPTIEDQWRDALELQDPGLDWPRDAYLLTPRDADPDADTWMATNWVADPVADPAFLAAIVPEAASTRLGTWIGVNRNLATFDTRVRLQQLTVPALVISATQDNFFPQDPDQATLRASLDAAVDACRTSYYFKNYGAQPLPPSGFQESDLGHNTQWGAPEALAADITAWIATGEPTADLPYADPNDVQNLLIDVGGATIIERHPPAGCP